MSLTLTVTTEEVPENLRCVISNPNWQSLISLLTVLIDDGYKINVGPGPIDPEDRIWPWLRLEADGRPDTVVGGQLYHYVGGIWLATHPMPVGAVMMYEGTEASITTFNGGESAAITDTAGPFWERVTQMNGKIPIGPGEITAGPPSVTITENENKGAYSTQLSDANIRHHRHWVAARQSTTSAPLPTSDEQIADDAGGNAQENYKLQGTGTIATKGRTSFVAGEDQSATNEAFPILPQVRGIWMIRRTARIYVRR